MSRNPAHTAEQPGGKLMCFPIIKWNTAKNKFKRCLAGLPQQYSSLLISCLVFKHSCGHFYVSQKRLNVTYQACVCVDCASIVGVVNFDKAKLIALRNMNSYTEDISCIFPTHYEEFM